jgi:hypothetical protein
MLNWPMSSPPDDQDVRLALRRDAGRRSQRDRQDGDGAEPAAQECSLHRSTSLRLIFVGPCAGCRPAGLHRQ